MNAVFLSYPLKSTNPVFGRESQELLIAAAKSIQAGDSCNTFRLGLENHWGTHVDCPNHFFDNGDQVCSYDASFWHFSNPQLIAVELAPGGLVNEKDIGDRILFTSDLLLLKSGWSQYRGTPLYSTDNPGISPDLGIWLRKERPALRAIGFDWISLTPYKNREIGRKAHRTFLDPEGDGEPIIIIEDLFLPSDIDTFREVWIAPIRIDGIDSAPCTVIASI